MPVVLTDILNLADNPFEVILLFIRYGGLVIFYPILVWACWKGWNMWIQEKFIHKKKFVLLAIDVPKLTEQNMKAIEQIITALHGVHFHPNKKEKHWIGVVQDKFSLEIVSIDGYIQYFIRCDHYNVDLVKGAIFAQYPDAEIVQVEDYVKNVPQKYPDEGYDLWGTEFTLANPSVYPLRTYEHFEHSLSGEFADPLADVLEALSRIQPGEQVWFQFVITPESYHWREEKIHEVDYLIGKEVPVPKTILDRVTDMPIKALEITHDAVFAGEAGLKTPAVEEKANTMGNFMTLTTGEKIVVEEIQKKLSRLVFETKFRFLYFAPKTIMNTYRVASPIFGAVKQFSALDLNSLKAGGHTTTSKPTYYLVKYRRNRLKNKLVRAYRNRSNEEGEAPFILSTAEVATLFHFPGVTVPAPLVSKTETKKAEPPVKLPIAASPFEAFRTGHQRVLVSEGPLHSMPGLPPGVKPVEEEAASSSVPSKEEDIVKEEAPHTMAVRSEPATLPPSIKGAPPANLPFG